MVPNLSLNLNPNLNLNELGAKVVAWDFEGVRTGRTFRATKAWAISLRTDSPFLFKALRGMAPIYLQDLCKSRPWDATSLGLLKVPRTWCKTFGDRAFAVAVPRSWNCRSLPIRESDSAGNFKRNFKTPNRDATCCIRLASSFDNFQQRPTMLYSTSL